MKYKYNYLMVLSVMVVVISLLLHTSAPYCTLARLAEFPLEQLCLG